MKIGLMLIALFALAANNLSRAQNPTPTISFSNNQTLQSPDLFYLYWNYDTQDITFELHAKTTGWVLFGIKGASFLNVIVATIFQDGTGHYSERTLFNNGTLFIHPTVNWFLSDIFVQNNYTVVKFYRKIKLVCNQSNDDLLGVNVNAGLNTLVFATGNNFNTSDDSILISSLNSAQVNLLPTITADSQLSCVSPPQTPVFNSTPTGYYSNYVDLIEGVYRLYWNASATTFTAEIHCQTVGWVGFGFSPNGGMVGSNVVVGYIASDGSVNFTDRYITSQSVAGVALTKNQSVTLLSYGRVNNYVYFKFTRNVTLCDSQHISISQVTSNIVFAYGTTQLSRGSDISYHLSNRGTMVLNMISTTPDPGVTVSNPEIIDFTVTNVVIPRWGTFYYCKIFPVPKATKKHIYKYELILPTVNQINIHHMVIYECDPTYNGTPSITNRFCYLDDSTSYCERASFAWAVGGQLVTFFPSDTGYPIGGDTDYSYIRVEIHYNNPNLDIGYFDAFTVRYYMTATLRPKELGSFALGASADSYGIAIPPGLSSFTLSTYCDRNCVANELQNQNITIVTALPHTHLAGISVETSIIRNGVDIGYVFANHHYDFNYQQIYLLNPQVVLTKNDQLITRCVYNTTGRTTFTLGGISTVQEMCFHYMIYYPRGYFNSCISRPYLNDYVSLLNNMSNSGEISLPFQLGNNLDNLTYGLTQAFAQLNAKPISSSVSNKFVQLYNSSRIMERCAGVNQPFMGPFNRTVASNVYTEPDVCAVNTTPSQPTALVQLIQNIISSIWNIIMSIFGRKS